MTGALLDHLWQSTLFCGGVWLLTIGAACERRGIASLDVAAGVAEVPRAVFGVAIRSAPWPDCRAPVAIEPDFLFHCQRLADGFAHQCVAAAGASAAPASTGFELLIFARVARSALGRRPALVLSHGTRPIGLSRAANAGAGRTTGCAGHGCSHRAIRGRRHSSGGVAAVCAARETDRPAAASRAGARTRAHLAARQPQGELASRWSKWCSGSIHSSGGSAADGRRARARL